MRQFSNDNEHDEDMAGVLSMPSGLLVTHLTAGEQLILWAFRHRRADDSPGSRCILHGFRLALGLAKVEAGLAVFESLWRCSGRGRSCPFAWHRCARRPFCGTSDACSICTPRRRRVTRRGPPASPAASSRRSSCPSSAPMPRPWPSFWRTATGGWAIREQNGRRCGTPRAG